MIDALNKEEKNIKLREKCTINIICVSS